LGAPSKGGEGRTNPRAANPANHVKNFLPSIIFRRFLDSLRLTDGNSSSVFTSRDGPSPSAGRASVLWQLLALSRSRLPAIRARSHFLAAGDGPGPAFHDPRSASGRRRDRRPVAPPPLPDGAQGAVDSRRRPVLRREVRHVLGSHRIIPCVRRCLFLLDESIHSAPWV